MEKANLINCKQYKKLDPFTWDIILPLSSTKKIKNLRVSFQHFSYLWWWWGSWGREWERWTPGEQSPGQTSPPPRPDWKCWGSLRSSLSHLVHQARCYIRPGLAKLNWGEKTFISSSELQDRLERSNSEKWVEVLRHLESLLKFKKSPSAKLGGRGSLSLLNSPQQWQSSYYVDYFA